MPIPSSRPSPRIMMISLHGYVSEAAEIGRPDTGGQVVYVLRLSEQLARMGFRVDIFTRRFDDQDEIEVVGDRVRIVRIPAGGRGLVRKEWMHEVVPEWVANAETWIRRRALEFAFIDSHYWDAGLAGTSLAERLAIPHVHTPHSLGAWKRDSMDGNPEELERQYNFARRIRDEQRILQSARGTIATSPQQRDLLVAGEYQVDSRRVAVIPPGYDDSRFFPVSRTTREAIQARLGLEGPAILALGRVAANKGYDLLLKALPTVVERAPSVTLVLAVGSTRPTPGETAQIEALQALAERLGVRARVRLLDYIPDERLADTYRAADVFALSSRYEPFGMTAVEAMACGTPAVITTKGGLWQMIEPGRDALCADPTDPRAFGEAIAAVLSHPEIAERLSRAGARQTRATFTWRGIASQVLRLLRQVGESEGPNARLTDPVVVRRRGARRETRSGSVWLRSASS